MFCRKTRVAKISKAPNTEIYIYFNVRSRSDSVKRKTEFQWYWFTAFFNYECTKLAFLLCWLELLEGSPLICHRVASGDNIIVCIIWWRSRMLWTSYSLCDLLNPYSIKPESPGWIIYCYKDTLFCSITYNSVDTIL